MTSVRLAGRDAAVTWYTHFEGMPSYISEQKGIIDVKRSQGGAMSGEVLVMIMFGAGIIVGLAFSLLYIVVHQVRDEERRWPVVVVPPARSAVSRGAPKSEVDAGYGEAGARSVSDQAGADAGERRGLYGAGGDHVGVRSRRVRAKAGSDR
jgi:hypothetical protein